MLKSAITNVAEKLGYALIPQWRLEDHSRAAANRAGLKSEAPATKFGAGAIRVPF